MLDELIGEKVVIDLRSQYVALGTLLRADELFLELKNADLHDLRDTDTTRELYVVDSRETGIKRNRKRVLVVRAEAMAYRTLPAFLEMVRKGSTSIQLRGLLLTLSESEPQAVTGSARCAAASARASCRR